MACQWGGVEYLFFIDFKIRIEIFRQGNVITNSSRLGSSMIKNIYVIRFFLDVGNIPTFISDLLI